ncbi:uridine kinase [Cytophagaceae bacterium YF14B1]|uniref:uridine/cytidine kinase n=1 Tax=Xanthocytophaga flava TaxID=3048013 RepID=A0AAE3U9F0_9BACT|nr:uridine kinase [Xanthocytophaga flavus]MDJ1481639.1 uridine kinase [Xanthocytophaga flavus]
MQRPFIVGITGGSGSGKTYFLNSLLKSFSSEEICLISQDNYYRPLEQQQLDSNGVQNFDLPEAIDHQLFGSHVKGLREGRTIQQKEYTFNKKDIEPQMLTFQPAPIIVVEGLFVLYYPEVANLLDLKIFIDAKEHIKLKRRIFRDNTERGYDLTDVLYRLEHHIVPAYEKYIAPLKHEADVIIPNNSHFKTALEMVILFLQSKVKSSISVK